jgi:hypothetical protein
MLAQIAADAQRAKDRSERLLQYQSEDEAAAAALLAEDQDDSAADGVSQESEALANESAAASPGDTERTQEA